MGIEVNRGRWENELVFYVVCLFAAGVLAGCAVGVLSLNLRPVELLNWRRRLWRSAFALIVLDGFVFETMMFSLEVLFLDDVSGTRILFGK